MCRITKRSTEAVKYTETRGIGFAHFIPLKQLRVVRWLGQLVRYPAVKN